MTQLELHTQLLHGQWWASHFLFELYVLPSNSQSGGQLASNARQTGNVLRILNINVENSGVYVCLATNNAGSDQVASVIDVERKYIDSIGSNWMNCVCVYL